ncbi:hypothetical protein PPACK8108_LOCUS23949 [Phakopsora pachyrhizi]|uniref:Uncharacterized protein n=1 Tax=Phakopsora pachyrhizi TaxID=170000 RepID=A0AAV0BQV5_PHAPC|nr:hypothetical protein PPACK8108_LOCUS23948 [Phakopsora pachyrhizi]CAH7688910.1 hypothetical protein PPACK8108_LOCUS23949 [Phakopsora pachyrhizi]
MQTNSGAARLGQGRAGQAGSMNLEQSKDFSRKAGQGRDRLSLVWSDLSWAGLINQPLKIQRWFKDGSSERACKLLWLVNQLRRAWQGWAGKAEDLLDLYQSTVQSRNPQERQFIDNIRLFIILFSFVSMGLKLDQKLANARDGVFTFKIHGAIHHYIGDLQPVDNIPNFL